MVTSLYFTASARLLFSGSIDNTVGIWTDKGVNLQVHAWLGLCMLAGWGSMCLLARMMGTCVRRLSISILEADVAAHGCPGPKPAPLLR